MIQLSDELVELDAEGVIRWKENGREVAFFGANYCLPSASDYRAAGKVGTHRKTLIEQDMAHFARLGFDGLRLSFWGDWENSDSDGNLRVCLHNTSFSTDFRPRHSEPAKNLRSGVR